MTYEAMTCAFVQHRHGRQCRSPNVRHVMSAQMSAYMSVRMPVHMSVHRPDIPCLSTYLTHAHAQARHPARHACTLPIHMYVHMSIHRLDIRRSMPLRMSTHMSIHMPIHMFAHMSIHMPMHMSTHMSMHRPDIRRIDKRGFRSINGDGCDQSDLGRLPGRHLNHRSQHFSFQCQWLGC